MWTNTLTNGQMNPLLKMRGSIEKSIEKTQPSQMKKIWALTYPDSPTSTQTSPWLLSIAAAATDDKVIPPADAELLDVLMKGGREEGEKREGGEESQSETVALFDYISPEAPNSIAATDCAPLIHTNKCLTVNVIPNMPVTI